MRDRSAVGAGCLFDRHPRFQRAVRGVGQHRVGKPPHDGDPELAVVRRRAVDRSHSVGSADAAPAAPAVSGIRVDA